MILVDPYNPRAKELYNALASVLNDTPITVVLGGDGWMLQCLREHHSLQPFLGLNAGTLGFLMNDVQDIQARITEIQNQSWKIHSFPLLNIKGVSSNGKSFTARALNDVYLTRLEGRTANLRVDIDGICIVEKLICDGIIVATSLGSTAYSSSAGGSPSHPLLQALHVTPICPHSPRLRSFLVPQEADISITALHPRRRPAQAVGDGISYGEAHTLQISCAPNQAHIAFLDSHNFTETMVRKVLRS